LGVEGSHPTETLRRGEIASEDGFQDTARVILPEKLLTVREVAERLGVCRATAYGMVERGDLPAVRIASAVRVHPADLQALVARRRG
jgi:excisionase family DNA binding protein